MKREMLLFIEDILENITDIESFSKNLSKNDLIKNKLNQKAILKSLEVIGEAVKNIPDSFRKNYPDIPWKKIAGFRDVLIHTYFGVDINRVWNIIKDDLPDLKNKIWKIKKDLESES